MDLIKTHLKTALSHEKKTVDTSSTFGAETPPGSEFLSLLRTSEFFFSLYSRLLADFLSHFGKWVRLIEFEAEYEHFYTKKV